MNMPELEQLNKIWYDADVITNNVSCRELVQDEFSAVINGNSSRAFWRVGADNDTAIFYNDNGTCHDFVKDEHYNSIQLYMLIHGVKFADAVNAMGDKYCPNERLAMPYGSKATKQAQNKPFNTKKQDGNIKTPDVNVLPSITLNLLNSSGVPSVCPAPPKNKIEQLLSDGFKLVKEYKYNDQDGNHIYSVLRFENGEKKEFVQRAANGSFLVKDLPKLLYNLPDLINAEKVYITEGEKCADCLTEHGFCATTTSGGAGKGRWMAEFNKYFENKFCVILTDGDEKGKEYGLILANELRKVTHKIKVVTPINEPKKDIVDFFMLGQHTPDDLLSLENATPFFKIPEMGEVTPEMVKVAKQKNLIPFANYTERKENGKIVCEPIQPDDLLNDFFARFLNFPCLLGKDVLFDHDQENKEIVELDKPQKLFAWISKKSKHNYLWKTGNGFIDKQEFFSMVMQAAHRFELISATPDFPRNTTTYYTHPTLPEPDKDHKYFETLVDFFNPDGKHGRELIKAIFLTPMYYRTSATKPSWIIDSKFGKGVGKTTIYDIMSKLYLCTPIQIHRDSFRNSDELDKRLVSNSGRKSKIFAIDNIEGRFSNEILAQYITASTLSGRAPYSAGEDSRPNNLTYVITCNSAEINGDLTSRSYFLFLKKFDNENHRWKEDVESFLTKFRWNIFADMLDIVKNHVPFNCKCFSRHRLFEVEIMQAVCKTQADFEEMMMEISESATVANTDSESAQEITSILFAKIADCGISADTSCVWIPSIILKHWFDDENIKKSIASVRQLAIDGHTKNIDPILDKFPRSSAKNPTRGIMWIGNRANTANAFVLVLKGKTINYFGESYKTK